MEITKTPAPKPNINRLMQTVRRHIVNLMHSDPKNRDALAAQKWFRGTEGQQPPAVNIWMVHALTGPTPRIALKGKWQEMQPNATNYHNRLYQGIMRLRETELARFRAASDWLRDKEPEDAPKFNVRSRPFVDEGAPAEVLGVLIAVVRETDTTPQDPPPPLPDTEDEDDDGNG
jgi:hypothetical protein